MHLRIGQFVIVQFLFWSFTAIAHETKVRSPKAQAGDDEPMAAFKLGDVEYFHRFTDKDLHEYTPQGQENLEKWVDMVSINYYNAAKDGEALASFANAVLENYKSHGAKVLTTKSVPRTEEKPAEHLIAASFAQEGFSELVFARFRLHKGVGTSVIYSHRVYGAKAKVQAIDWLKKNSNDIEKTILKWDAMPDRPAATEKNPQK